ncbi:MAG: hypothetical protein QOF81_3435 [Acidimicrobiaceae bacterium]|nr:hypothetical protein [Acidimicrobiaceae bacterium]
MSFHGGPVEGAPAVYVVFWGWTSDPSGEAPYLTSFLSSVGASPWLNTVTEYGGGNPGSLYRGSWSDGAPVPTQPTDAQLQSEAAKAADHFAVGTSVDVEIVVATPTRHSAVGFGSNYCAYHGAVGARPNITYTNLPYMTDAGAACGAGRVNGARGNLDGVSIVAGHELAEVITDPLLNAWTDSSGFEIADKCAWTNLVNIGTNRGSFAVQPLWSNASNGCVTSSPDRSPTNDLSFVKTRNTGSGQVEVHSATQATAYQSGQHNATWISTADASNGWFQMVGADLWFVKTVNTGSGHVEVHSATQASGYQSGQHFVTWISSADASNGLFQMVGPDVSFVKVVRTGSGHVEVHSATQASGYQSGQHFVTWISTADASNGWFQMVGADLFFVKTVNTGSGHVEVHSATQGSGYQAGNHDATWLSTIDAKNGWFQVGRKG